MAIDWNVFHKEMDDALNDDDLDEELKKAEEN